MSKNKHTKQAVANVESALVKAQVKLGSLLARTGIAASQWSQYKGGFNSPSVERWVMVEMELAGILEEIRELENGRE
ncbi:MAG: hypothetical protein COB09_16995 [Thalassobium sp.]|nr:MAG: hypothetical protein COB09_16995 [Thalassobium sp.]